MISLSVTYFISSPVGYLTEKETHFNESWSISK